MLAPKEFESQEHHQDPTDRLSLASFEHLANEVPGCVLLLLDQEGRIQNWSSGAASLYGYTKSEIIGGPHARLYAREDVEAGAPSSDLQKAAADGSFIREGWQVRETGSRFRAEIRFKALRKPGDAAGSGCSFFALIQDVTTRYERERALERSEELSRLMVRGVRDYAIFSLDPRGYITSWNEGARLIKGYEADEIIGSHFSRFYPPDAIERQWPEYELHVATTEGRFEDEGWRLRKDGTRFWANVVITALRDPRGTLLGFCKITRDLTERRAQSEILRQSEERFRLLVDRLQDHAILILDADGLIRSWNRGAERILGYRADEVLFKHVSNLYRSDEVAASVPWHALTTSQERGEYQEEGWRPRKQGEPFWAKVHITALTDVDGRLYGYAHVTQDLTAERSGEAWERLTRSMSDFMATAAAELQQSVAALRRTVGGAGKHHAWGPELESMCQAVARETGVLAHVADELTSAGRMARRK